MTALKEKQVTEETVKRFEEIRMEIEVLVQEAMDLLPINSMVKERARVYWKGHILSAVGNINYCTHATTMERTQEELEILI